MQGQAVWKKLKKVTRERLKKFGEHYTIIAENNRKPKPKPKPKPKHKPKPKPKPKPTP
jgi:hypothetical protein